MKNLPINRKQAIELLKKYNHEEKDMYHYLKSEAIMRELAKKFEQDKEYWGMLGLLHDIDWVFTKNNPSEHLKKTPEILKQQGFNEEFIEIIISHGYGAEILTELKDKKRTKNIEKALCASETITGLIYAYALMRNKKISDMTTKGLKKKFKDKTFAANCDRENIKEIEDIGLTLDEFFELSIKAIQNIKEDVGLE